MTIVVDVVGLTVEPLFDSKDEIASLWLCEKASLLAFISRFIVLAESVSTTAQSSGTIHFKFVTISFEPVAISSSHRYTRINAVGKSRNVK